MAQAAQQSQVSPERIMNDLWRARGVQALVAGVELDIFTHIANGAKTAKEIAKASKASLRGIGALLDALVAMEYLNKKGDRYGLEPVTDTFLVKSKQSYIGDFAFETRLSWEGWGHLSEVVKTGRPVWTVDKEEQGREFFPKLVSAIFPMSFGAATNAAKAIPQKSLKQVGKILDVAAGSGAWSLAFALALPEAKVTAMDFPEVTPITKQFAERFGVADRYDYIEGNLRELNFGRNLYDLVILGHIIHSEGEKWGKKLIKKSYGALREGGKLLIAEMVPNDTRTGPALPLIFGLNMLLHTAEGGVYTMRQYREWLKGAGFSRVTTLNVPGPSPLILATK